LEALVESASGAALDPEARAVLLRERLIVQVGNSREVFSFSHDLIREVAYESMLQKQCRQLHEQAASALVDNRIFDAPAGTLAHHFLLAEDSQRAVTWSERAGNDALGAGAFEEAATYFKRCLELSSAHTEAPSLEERVRFHRKLCDAFSGLGDPDARAREARKGLVLAGEPEPKQGPTSVSRAAGELLQRTLPDFTGKKPGGLDLELSRLYRHLAHVAYFESDGPGLLVSSLRAVRLAERAEPSSVLCGSLAELGGALGLGGLHALGMRYLDRAINVAERIEHPHGLSHALMVRALYLVGRGEWEQADLSARRAEEIAEALDDSVNFGNAKIIRFWIAYHRRESTRAEGILRALLTRAERTGNRQQKAWARRGFALLRLRSSSFGAALAELELARNDSATTDANEWMPVLGSLASCRLGLGEANRALELMRSALELAEKLGRPTGHGILTGLVAISEVALTLSRAEPQHRPLVERSLSRLEAYARVFPIGAPALHRLQGVYARDLGQAGRARRAFGRALEAAERLGMKEEQLLLARDARGTL
jgi:tetratricopeptide (TPR) repeat protein